MNDDYEDDYDDDRYFEELDEDYCCDCGGIMEWCDCCAMYTKTCCEDYGTCMCS